MKTAFLFPGQGAQQIGMGKDFLDASPAARAVFAEAEKVSGLPITKLCLEGPEDELARTDNCQPAIFTMSAAVLAAMKETLGDKMPQADFVAGLSLGEYTALYAAGAMDLATAIKLVTLRGRAMQDAATAVASGMVAITGLDEPKAQELCSAAAEGQVLACANFNAPGQIVLSGQIEACKRAEEKAKDFGASGAIPLKVAGAFHSQIMAPAADRLAAALDGSSLSNPTISTLANVDAKPYSGAADIKPKLLSQLTGAVRWQQCIEYLAAQGVEKFYEIGPGKVLAGLMRRINRRADITSINSVEVMGKIQ